jgi:hypothetical protein
MDLNKKNLNAGGRSLKIWTRHEGFDCKANQVCPGMVQ